MDVTCEQCKAEYDFDDTLLGDKGTTVKCSQCGHVFRVLPPRREPTRSALKVRFARDGHVEAVGSLRELQQRIQAGQVDVEDELGRDGFTFRKLGDVPELRNFFARGASQSAATLSAPAAMDKLSQRAEARAKRTVMGVGPSAHDVPTSPRMQGLGPGRLAAQALAPTQPGSPNPKGTIQGRAPISTAPTAPNTPLPREPPSRHVPIGSAPTPSGTAPTVPSAAPLQGISVSGPPGGASASTYPESGPRVAPLRIPDSEPPRSLRAPELRHGATDSIAPGALKAAARPRGASAAPPARGGGNVRLHVEDDELPPERASRGSSKLLLLVALFAVLGVGGFFVSRRLNEAGGPVDPGPEAAAPAPDPSADPASAGAAPLAEPPAAEPLPAPDAGAQPLGASAAPSAAEPTPEKPTDKPPAEKPPTGAAREQNVPARGSAREPNQAASKPAEPAAGKPAEAASGGSREPKDYSGWVARGEQLFSRGDMTGAREAFEAAVALRGTGSEANSGLGSVLLALGQTREAVPYLSRAAASGFAEASVGLGDAHRKLGQSDSAIEAYETYLARLPKGSRAKYVRQQLEALGKHETSEPAPPPRSESPSRPNDEYRPAGELTEPPPAETRPPSAPAGENVP